MDIASIRSSNFVIVFRTLVALQQRRALGDPGRTWGTATGLQKGLSRRPSISAAIARASSVNA